MSVTRMLSFVVAWQVASASFDQKFSNSRRTPAEVGADSTRRESVNFSGSTKLTETRETVSSGGAEAAQPDRSRKAIAGNFFITSHLRETPEQVMIAVGQLDHTAVIRQRLVDLVDCHVAIEQQRTMAVVAHHALYPEEGCQTHAARHWFYVVQAARRVDHHVSGGEFDCMLTVDVVNNQFAAFVVFRRAEK